MRFIISLKQLTDYVRHFRTQQCPPPSLSQLLWITTRYPIHSLDSLGYIKSLEQILEVDPTADAETIKKAHPKAAFCEDY